MERTLSGLSASCSSHQVTTLTQKSFRTRVVRLNLAPSRLEAIVVAAAFKQAQASAKGQRSQGDKAGKIGPKQGAKGKQAAQPAPQHSKQEPKPQTRQGSAAPTRRTATSFEPPRQKSSTAGASSLQTRLRTPARPLEDVLGTCADPAPGQASTLGTAVNAAPALTASPEPPQPPAGQTAATEQDNDASSRAAACLPVSSGGEAGSRQAAGSPFGDESGDSEFRDGIESDDGEAFPQIELSLPPPTKVKVKSADYLQSAVSVSGCPPPRYPEFAVIGRSNVGKSSLINMMTGRKDLALVSKEPGKTKCINHFLINSSWYLVDLPGYGYARVGLQGRITFDAFTKEYFTTRPNLAMVLLLVDASIPPQRIDLDYANWLTDNDVPFTLVFTKADKRRKGLTPAVRDSHVVAFKRALLQDLAYLPPTLLTSSAKGLGRGALMNLIASLRVAYEKSGRLQAIKHGMV